MGCTPRLAAISRTVSPARYRRRISSPPNARRVIAAASSASSTATHPGGPPLVGQQSPQPLVSRYRGKSARPRTAHHGRALPPFAGVSSPVGQSMPHPLADPGGELGPCGIVRDAGQPRCDPGDLLGLLTVQRKPPSVGARDHLGDFAGGVDVHDGPRLRKFFAGRWRGRRGNAFAPFFLVAAVHVNQHVGDIQATAHGLQINRNERFRHIGGENLGCDFKANFHFQTLTKAERRRAQA